SPAAAQREEPDCTLLQIASITTPSFLLCVCAPVNWSASISAMPAMIMVESCWNMLKMSSLLMPRCRLLDTRACDRRTPLSAKTSILRQRDGQHLFQTGDALARFHEPGVAQEGHSLLLGGGAEFGERRARLNQPPHF